MTVEVLPLAGVPEVSARDDLAGVLEPPLRAAGARDGDIVAVTQKVVSKAEGRVVPAGGADWIAAETRRVVARRNDIVIVETRHGLVCANAGVDASNVAPGFVSLLPEDPDRSAAELRAALADRLSADVAVVITDTFGRAWRQGVLNVAIGCAGLPALVDLRGHRDDRGRELTATVVALADEVAAASGLVMPKAGRIPAAIVRGVGDPGSDGGAASSLRDRAPVPAAGLIREPRDDLFRESPLLSISARRTIRSFGAGPVPRAAVAEAVAAACTAPAPHHTRPWLFVALDAGPARRRLLAAMAEAWIADLHRDETPAEVIRRRLDRSDAVLEAAPMLVVPCVRMRGAHAYGDDERAGAERDMFVLAGGAGIQAFLLALHAQGLASSWISSTLFCRDETREALGLDEEWIPLGSIAVGRPPEGEPPPRPPIDVADHLRFA
jgi:coenzyme F420-0:L-glutamate ligase / coenzyme F420-1:gamma-L-glutamate ligase